MQERKSGKQDEDDFGNYIQSVCWTTFWADYNKFADACGDSVGKIGTLPPQNKIELSKRLINEEWNEETLPALEKYENNPSLENFAEVADGIADTIYVLCKLARELGVPLDDVWIAVHEANMAKIGPDGKVTRREDGKILKPEGWQKANVWQVCFDHWKTQRDAEQT